VKGSLPATGTVILTSKKVEGYTCLLTENPTVKLIQLINYIKSNNGFKTLCGSPEFGENVSIGKNVVIEDGVIIGSNTLIEHNVVIHAGTVIGDNCIIRSGATIGGEGYGFIQDKDSVLRQPFIGSVYIGQNVEIGYNCTVVRGAIENTILEDNVKLDNLVHIAHDVFVGKGSTVTAGVSFCGFVKVGENTRIAPNATIKQRLNIGSNALIGLGAVVTKNVKDNEVVAGNPAKPLRFLNK
jgi:UDP-3-O-[3-hydroxymyristoyl] glucosamine N-acyltransferase